MRKGHASGTARLVAFWRAAADLGLTTIPGFSDPVARYMLRGRGWQIALDRALSLLAKPRSETRRSALPYLYMIVLRVAFIDALIEEWTARSTQPARAAQVVILGAGLDTRCFRLQALRTARVFELDHPDTQAYKRERVSRLGPPLAKQQFVPIDFTRDQLASVLVAAGFQPSQPTLWVWEGVIMYLDDAALSHTLRAVHALSAPGSMLLAHYHEPRGSDPHNLVRQLVLSWLREPQIGLRTSQVMHEAVERAGFTVAEDAGVPEQAARVGARAPDNVHIRISRILVATRV